jgi:hypothetical protein
MSCMYFYFIIRCRTSSQYKTAGNKRRQWFNAYEMCTWS